jgi:hypothetical protein
MRVHFLSTTLVSCVRRRVGVRENFRNGSSWLARSACRPCPHRRSTRCQVLRLHRTKQVASASRRHRHLRSRHEGIRPGYAPLRQAPNDLVPQASTASPAWRRSCNCRRRRAVGGGAVTVGSSSLVGIVSRVYNVAVRLCQSSHVPRLRFVSIVTAE